MSGAAQGHGRLNGEGGTSANGPAHANGPTNTNDPANAPARRPVSSCDVEAEQEWMRAQATEFAPAAWMRGLTAFPLTPLAGDRIDEIALIRLVVRLVEAAVDSIAVLGSTGSYAYLDRSERRRVVHTAVQHARGIPVIAGVGALRTSQVLACADDAQRAGASALLLAPVSYQPLTEDEVYTLFQTVDAATDLPIIVYDNPATTHFEFSLELYGRLAALPRVAAVKIPPVPLDAEDPADISAARAHVAAIREAVGPETLIAVSGDPAAAAGLLAGCDAWHSVVGGVLPEQALRLTRAAQSGDAEAAHGASDALRPLWDLYASAGGSVRVVAAAAEALGVVAPHCLPLPVKGLSPEDREQLAQFLDTL